MTYAEWSRRKALVVAALKEAEADVRAHERAVREALERKLNAEQTLAAVQAEERALDAREPDHDPVAEEEGEE